MEGKAGENFALLLTSSSVESNVQLAVEVGDEVPPVPLLLDDRTIVLVDIMVVLNIGLGGVPL